MTNHIWLHRLMATICCNMEVVQFIVYYKKMMASMHAERARLIDLCRVGKFVECVFFVFEKSYQVQVLHHVATMTFIMLLFIVTNENTILYCTLLIFNLDDMDMYIGILDAFYEELLKWAYKEGLMPEMREEMVGDCNYHVNLLSVKLNCIWHYRRC